MKIPEKLYQRGLCVWLASGLVLLSGWLVYKLLTAPFEASYLFLSWLVSGLILMGVYGIIKLWDEDLYF